MKDKVPQELKIVEVGRCGGLGVGLGRLLRRLEEPRQPELGPQQLERGPAEPEIIHDNLMLN